MLVTIVVITVVKACACNYQFSSFIFLAFNFDRSVCNIMSHTWCRGTMSHTRAHDDGYFFSWPGAYDPPYYCHIPSPSNTFNDDRMQLLYYYYHHRIVQDFLFDRSKTYFMIFKYFRSLQLSFTLYAFN